MAKAVEIPVYLFTGFLEGGKTRFIRETLEDKKFNAVSTPCWCCARRARRNTIFLTR